MAQEKRAGGLPASIQNVALDELQRMFVDSLKKLKARDKRIADLAEAQKAVAAENAALREQVAAVANRPTEPNGADSRLQVPVPFHSSGVRLALAQASGNMCGSLHAYAHSVHENKVPSQL